MHKYFFLNNEIFCELDNLLRWLQLYYIFYKQVSTENEKQTNGYLVFDKFQKQYDNIYINTI